MDGPRAGPRFRRAARSANIFPDVARFVGGFRLDRTTERFAAVGWMAEALNAEPLPKTASRVAPEAKAENQPGGVEARRAAANSIHP